MYALELLWVWSRHRDEFDAELERKFHNIFHLGIAAFPPLREGLG
jgi:hypothetical protein